MLNQKRSCSGAFFCYIVCLSCIIIISKRVQKKYANGKIAARPVQIIIFAAERQCEFMENNKIELREKCCIFSKCIDADLDYQENLMSYNDDLLKIIRCNINNFIINYVYKNSVLTVYGKAKIFLTYISEATGCISTAEFEEDFEKSINIDGNYEDVCADISVCNKYNNCRVINQRRVDIHNSFVLKIKAYSDVCSSMLKEEENILINREEVSFISKLGSQYSKSEFSEEISIEEAECVKKIINVFSTSSCEDIKIVSDKLLVKSNVSFSVLYTTDTEKEIIKRCEKSTQISTIIDLPGVQDGDIAFADITTGNLFSKAKADKNNELKIIELIGDINVNCSVFKKQTELLSSDSYSVINEVSNDYQTVELMSDYSIERESLSQSVLFEIESLSIKQILDLSVSIVDESVLEMNAFVTDENGELRFITDRKKLDIASFEVSQAFLSSFDYVIKSEKSINVRITVNYSGLSYTAKKYRIVSGVKINSDKTFESPALAVYFADKNEKLWDIAKTFRTSVELIKRENELDSDVLDTKRVLLIPGM